MGADGPGRTLSADLPGSGTGSRAPPTCSPPPERTSPRSRRSTCGSTTRPAESVWTVDGEDYTKHYYPPNLRSCEFTPDSLIGEMDYAGIDANATPHEPDAGAKQRLSRRVRPEVSGPSLLDGPGRRVAHPGRYGRRHPRAEHGDI